MTPRPTLPETPFTSLAPARLEAMIDHALSHPQQGQTPGDQVIVFRPRWQGMAFGSGMAAMAASVVLALMLAPAYSPTSQVAEAPQADLTDLLLLDTLGA